MSDDDRRTRRLTRQIESFAGRHGGARGQVSYLGRPGARLVLVGADGTWGDLVAPSMQSATAAAEAAGVALRESFDGELAAGVRTGPYEWSRMAGIQVGGPATPGAPETVRDDETPAKDETSAKGAGAGGTVKAGETDGTDKAGAGGDAKAGGPAEKDGTA